MPSRMLLSRGSLAGSPGKMALSSLLWTNTPDFAILFTSRSQDHGCDPRTLLLAKVGLGMFAIILFCAATEYFRLAPCFRQLSSSAPSHTCGGGCGRIDYSGLSSTSFRFKNTSPIDIFKTPNNLKCTKELSLDFDC